MKLHRIFGATLIAFVVAIATLSATVARATSFSTDQSDVWSVAGEPGWAIQLVQRGSAIFATMYVYGPSGQPTFYSATLEATGASYTWTGDLIATTGPWFGAVPFNPALVTIRRVGTMTWNATSVPTGTLTYSVDGVGVVKLLVRYLARYDDYNGIYVGGLHGDATGCFTPSGNVSGNTFVTTHVSQNGLSVSIVIVGQATGGTITISGTMSQYGQFGTVAGSYTSSEDEVGSVTLFEVNGQLNAFTARFVFNSTNNGCTTTGYLGGIRERP